MEDLARNRNCLPEPPGHWFRGHGAGLLLIICLVLPPLSLGQQLQTATGAVFIAPAPVADHHVRLRSSAAALQQSRRALTATSRTAAPFDAIDALGALDQAQVNKAVLISSAHVFSQPDLDANGELAMVQAENNYVAEQVAVAPDRFVGLCAVNPLMDYAMDEARRCKQELGLTGLKLHFANSDVRLRNAQHIEQLRELFAFLDLLDFPVLMHVRTRNPAYGSIDVKLLIDNVLSEAPNLSFQVAQMAGQGGYDAATDRALGEFLDAFADGRLQPAKFQFDLAAVVADPEQAANAEDRARISRNNRRLSGRLEAMDHQQVVFASGWPSWPQATPEADKIANYWSSLERLLDVSPLRLRQIFQTEGRLLNPISDAGFSRQ